MTIHPLFENIIKAQGLFQAPHNPYRASQTIHMLEQILADNIVAAERLESQIGDLEAELRDAKNDWQEGRAIQKLTAARAQLQERVQWSARDLGTIAGLREKAGLESHLLTRIMVEYNKSTSTKDK